MEDSFRPDRNSMQHDTAWSAKTMQLFLSLMYDMKTSETLFDKVTTDKLNLFKFHTWA
jgi:hypothetical protein